MILPGVTLFPHSLLPLYIFEPRYREMLADSLAGHRMFAIAHAGEDGEVAAIGGLGVVRACVQNDDGTSNLILQGLSRVVFSGLRMKPYPRAAIVGLPDTATDAPEIQRLRQDVAEACLQMRAAGLKAPEGFESYLEQMNSAGAFADAVAAAYIADPTERRGLLEEPDVAERLGRLVRCLMRRLQTP